jgi:hypothetical protein
VPFDRHAEATPADVSQIRHSNRRGGSCRRGRSGLQQWRCREEALVVGEVVVGEEDGAEHFVGLEEVAEVAAAVAAGEAGAVFFDGPVVALVNFVAETHGAGIGEGEGVAAVVTSCCRRYC